MGPHARFAQLHSTDHPDARDLRGSHLVEIIHPLKHQTLPFLDNARSNRTADRASQVHWDGTGAQVGVAGSPGLIPA